MFPPFVQQRKYTWHFLYAFLYSSYVVILLIDFSSTTLHSPCVRKDLSTINFHLLFVSNTVFASKTNLFNKITATETQNISVN